LRWPAIKKTRRDGRTIIFIDESGLSQRPHRCRARAPRGETPVLHVNSEETVDGGGLTVWNIHFRLYADSLKKGLVRKFVKY
jgi:hypothetical protein